MVKVADFGLSKSTYEKLYFRQEKSDNVRLPIKWLAVECIEDGVFSEKSDVVSVYMGGGTGGAGGASAPPKISVGEHCSPFQQLLFCK